MPWRSAQGTISKLAGSPGVSRRSRYRTLLLRVGPLYGAIPQIQVATALEDHIDPRLIERAGAQVEQQLGCVLPVSARDLKTPGADILGEDGQGNAQCRLSEFVLLIDLRALADQKF